MNVVIPRCKRSSGVDLQALNQLSPNPMSQLDNSARSREVSDDEMEEEIQTISDLLLTPASIRVTAKLPGNRSGALGHRSGNDGDDVAALKQRINELEVGNHLRVKKCS
jgi:hypothetical protein